MSNQQLHPKRPASPAFKAMARHRPRVARVGRALKLAALMFLAGSQCIPLGDNSELLADLAARARAA